MAVMIKRFLRIAAPAETQATAVLLEADVNAFLATLTLNQILDVRFETEALVDRASILHSAVVLYLTP